MKRKYSVELGKSGNWTVRSLGGSHRTMDFATKADAVIYARNNASEGEVLVRTASGQILRPPLLTPTRDPQAMRDAVLEAVMRHNAKSGRA